MFHGPPDAASPRLKGTPALVASLLPNRSRPLDQVGWHLSPSMRRRICRKETPGQVTFGLEQALLEARQRPVLDGDRQDQPTHQIAQVVGNDPEQQADLVGPEAVAGEPRPMGGSLALLDPLLRGPALVVEANDRPVRPREGGDDEAHPRKEFAEVMLDLGDYASGPVPGGHPIVEAAVADQRGGTMTGG